MLEHRKFSVITLHILSIIVLVKSYGNNVGHLYCFYVSASSTMSDENEKSSSDFDDITSFLKNSTVFLTGVTGFLGHVLLAKLLR